MSADEFNLVKAVMHRYNIGQILPRMIWLDDALLSQYEIAFPLLKKYRIKKGIVIAVPTAYVGKTFPWNDPPVELPMMTIEQIKEMVKYGCHIASHTVNHVRLDKVSEEKLRWELRESAKWINENIGVDPKFFVAPQDKYPESPHLMDVIKSRFIFVRPPYANAFHVVAHMLKDDPEHKLSKRWGKQIERAKFNFELELRIEKIARRLIMK